MFRAIFEFTNMRAIVTVLDEFYDTSDFNRSYAEYNISEWGNTEWDEGGERAEYNVSEWNNIGWNEQFRVFYSVPNAAANLSALFYYVNMRATYELVSPNFGGGDVGGSRFDSRAIDEWTFNG